MITREDIERLRFGPSFGDITKITDAVLEAQSGRAADGIIRQVLEEIMTKAFQEGMRSGFDAHHFNVKYPAVNP